MEKNATVLIDFKKWQEIYGGSRAMFYRLVNAPGVPSVTIGGRKFLIRDQFDEWPKKQHESL